MMCILKSNCTMQGHCEDRWLLYSCTTNYNVLATAGKKTTKKTEDSVDVTEWSFSIGIKQVLNLVSVWNSRCRRPRQRTIQENCEYEPLDSLVEASQATNPPGINVSKSAPMRYRHWFVIEDYFTKWCLRLSAGKRYSLLVKSSQQSPITQRMVSITMIHEKELDACTTDHAPDNVCWPRRVWNTGTWASREASTWRSTWTSPRPVYQPPCAPGS